MQPLALDPALIRVSPQERSWGQGLPVALQQRYLISRSLLRQRLASLFDLPAEAIPLHSPPGQAPRLDEGYGYVSLSHSRSQCLLAWSSSPVGVDLEWSRRPLQAEPLARRFFPDAEWQQIRWLPQPQLTAAVLERWVRKEAAIKWQASGLASDLRHWFWDGEAGRLTHLEQGWQPACVCQLRDGWWCAVVGDAAEQGIWG